MSKFSRGEGRIRLGAGDFVAIPPGAPFHTIWNRASEAAEMLVFSSAREPDEVVYEPEATSD
jgi:uncharacterized RmlC-like cupin family protein